MGDQEATRGILRPRVGFEHFDLDRAEAPADLRALISGLWTVQWDLPAGQTFEQEILPFPNANLAFEGGELNVHGPTKARFVARLSGRGWVAGLRFRPAGFFALSARPLSEVAERTQPAHQALGLVSPVCPPTPQEARAVLIDHVRACLERRLDGAVSEHQKLERISEWVERLETDPSIRMAADLARHAQVSVRTLQRMLEKYVGVGSKWIVRRARIQHCAELVAQGQYVNWAEVASELGHHDQAHLIRDFKEQMGLTPHAYAKQCAGRRV